MHNLSEFTGRPGPFAPDERNFEGFDPPRARADERLRLIDSLINEWDYSEQEARIQAHLDQAEWQGIGRYHICVFSNFLTSPQQVLNLSSELTNVFRALKPRGIVIVVGGTGADYPLVYEFLDRVAREARVQRVSAMPEAIPCRYNNAEADAIKQLYSSVFDSLRHVVPIGDLDRTLPHARDLWVSDVPLKGPREFGVRVYRAPDRPLGARFKKLNRHGDDPRNSTVVG